MSVAEALDRMRALLDEIDGKHELPLDECFFFQVQQDQVTIGTSCFMIPPGDYIGCFHRVIYPNDSLPLDLRYAYDKGHISLDHVNPNFTESVLQLRMTISSMRLMKFQVKLRRLSKLLFCVGDDLNFEFL